MRFMNATHWLHKYELRRNCRAESVVEDAALSWLESLGYMAS